MPKLLNKKKAPASGVKAAPRAARAVAPKAAAKPALIGSVPCAANIAQFELANGIKVYAYENFASPAVVVSGYLHTGSIDEDAGRSRAGLAGFVTDCLTRGTERYSYERIFEETESIGANLSVSAGTFTTGLFSKSLAEDLPLMLDLLSDVIRRPTFPEAEVEKERAEWLTDLQERTNSTRSMTSLSFYELCYPDTHPFHYSSDGYPESAKNIGVDELRAFHKRNFSPQDMVITVVGAIKAEAARDQIARAFGDWDALRATRSISLEAPPVTGRPRRHVSMAGKSQSNLMFGFPALPNTHPDWLACALMNSILGQFGMYGRLGESVRKEEGLVYYIGSRFDGGITQGPWYCYAGTNPSTVDRVVDIALKEVRRMQDKKVSPTELEDNQRYFTGVMPLQMETNEGVAGQIINMVRYNRGMNWLLDYPERVHAITREDIQRVARTWLSAENYVLATAGA